jgi:hypothetical protein
MPDQKFDTTNPFQPRIAKFPEADPGQQVPDVTKVLDLPQLNIAPLAAEPGSTDAQVPPEPVPDKA